MTMVVPSLFSSVSSCITSAPFFESRLPVGSSARMIFGLETTARAIGPGEVLTPGGVIHAKAVVLATHFPIVNVPGFFFFRMHQERSYVLALENAAPVGGMYIGEEKNSLSFRDAEGLLLFGGAGTRTGKNREGGNFEQLMQSAKVFYPACKAVYRWAAQDCMPHDQIPYIGLLSEKWPGV